MLYFKTLVIMGCLMVACFLLNLWTIGYFSSDKYSGGYQQKSEVVAMFPRDLVGSALCPTERQQNFNLTNGQQADLHLCPFNATQVCGLSHAPGATSNLHERLSDVPPSSLPATCGRIVRKPLGLA